MTTPGDALDQTLIELPGPVAIVSTAVGRGMVSLGDAVAERLTALGVPWHHVPLEDLLPPAAVNEDYARYKLISNHAPWLLNLVYRLPIIYQRKLWRERLFGAADLGRMQRFLDESRPGSLLAISHRPAFWLSACKRRGGTRVPLWGLLGEYGPSLGWTYIPWEAMDGFLSPIPREALGFRLPRHVALRSVELPARAAFSALRDHPGNPKRALVVAGLWGQHSFVRLVDELLSALPDLELEVVCGENERAFRVLCRGRPGPPRLTVHAKLPSLAEAMGRASAVITKPGISTLLEAHAAGRSLFLLRGMPVAEDHNAAYALRCFGARWFSVADFRAWYVARRPRPDLEPHAVKDR